MGSAASTTKIESNENENLVNKILAARVRNGDNLMAKHFSEEYLASLPNDKKSRLLKICKSGADNYDSSVGMYAQQPDDYDEFAVYFDKVIREYHKISGDKIHVNNWDLSSKTAKLGELGCADGKLDLAKLGLEDCSMRVRVGRNLSAFPLPGSMSRNDRVQMETKMIGAFKNLIADKSFGGQYYSLTPGNPYHINEQKYKELVHDHIMFKDMSADKYLNSAGISSNWPYGRGCYVSADKQFIVWVGEEDHLRIMCMVKGTVLNTVFDRLQVAEKIVEKYAGTFARSKNYGYVTSCPTNLGTGMRASIHVKLPFLTSDGTDKKAKAVCKPLGLSVRGLGGEHTPIGADGTVDISPSARLMIEEADIICSLYGGIRDLIKAETSLSKEYEQQVLKQIAAAKTANPDNLMAKHFDTSYYQSLPSDLLRLRLLKICKSGADNTDSSLGMYAMQPDDYDVFATYMDKVVRGYHKIEGEKVHVTNWDLASKNLSELGVTDGKLDLSKLGLGKSSMRVRVGRNLSAFPLPGAMSQDDRVQMETKMIGAFKNLIADKSFGGQYYSLTPGNPCHINEQKYKELVNEHIMFKDMSADPYLNSAGISSNWPYGRGCYVSADKQFIVWVGEEDHLRIMCMMQGTVLNNVFDRLQNAEKIVEKYAGPFARSKNYGYVTSCPTNLGTGMRASIHVKLPFLTSDGTDKKAKAVCKPLGLSVRGLGGEHTPIGADGTVDISPSARLMIEEADIICSLYKGIKLLLEAETKAQDEKLEVQAKEMINMKPAHPDNLMLKHFDLEYFNTLSIDMKKRLLQICRSGYDNPQSSLGMYAMQPNDYDTFNTMFAKVIKEYHKIESEINHTTNWDLKSKQAKLEELGVKDGKLDLSNLKVGSTSMRVRVGRNLSAFPLPGAMSQDDRVQMETKMIGAFKNLIADKSFGGQYYSLTPGNPFHIGESKYQELVNDHIMFKDMSADPYLNSAGISSNWPYGRGCYVSADKQFIVWVGEEDHLRIMCMMQGTVLNNVFDRLQTAEKIVEKYAGPFARSKNYGYVTSCPTNLGTGMRASIHIKLPNLTKDGTDKKAKAVCKPLGLSVRGLGGEHTPIGADGTVDISPSARLMIEEADIICALYKGVQSLMVAENETAVA